MMNEQPAGLSVPTLSETDALEIHPPARTSTAQRFLTPKVQDILIRLHRKFEPERQHLLNERRERQSRYDAGELPGYLDRASQAAAGDWSVNRIPHDLVRRRVEITGPINSTKMVINMLSRNQDGFMADTAMLDFEDSMKPSWNNVMDGVANLVGAARGSLSCVEPASSGQQTKRYRLNPDDMPVIMVRVRGLHLDESNVRIDGIPVAAGLLDFVLSFYHSTKLLILRGRTPTYYIPKCEHYLEARWWNDLFIAVQEELDLPRGTLRATFLIETLPAAFQMEEILYEIREHAAGLNVGRWDKIFSDIKILRNHPDRIMADRGTINLQKPWMLNYARRLIKICHTRGAYAIGGMSAFTPGRTPELRKEQTEKVIEDKRFEASIGHDGCWVSHPYFIGRAMSAFTRDNQLDVVLGDFDKYPDLLPQSTRPRTMEGLRKNIRVGIAYLHGWNHDIGCVAWDGLMEDLATLEISRAQVWQWLHHRVMFDDGTYASHELVKRLFDEEYQKIVREIVSEGEGQSKAEMLDAIRQFAAARDDARRIFTQTRFDEFLSTESELYQG